MIQTIQAIIVPMPSKRKKAGRGGRRKGAGRKPFLKHTRALTVTLQGPEYQAVARLADERGESLGSIVREAVRAYTAKRKR